MASVGAGSGERASPAAAAAAGGAGVVHASPFKLRFAAEREPGRSRVSPARPRGLPESVTGKFYAREPPPSAGGEAHLVRRVRDAFALGPARRLAAPELSSHQYGWWAGGPPAPRGDRRLHHHIRDSAWMRARLRVLCAQP